METQSTVIRHGIAALLVVLAWLVGEAGAAPNNEFVPLFISDDGDNTVKQFDADTGRFLGNFVAPGADGLGGPMGLIFYGGRLQLVNQNVNSNNNGEILRFDERTGAFIDKLVPGDGPNAPFAPRGLIRGTVGPANTLYVADLGTAGNVCTNQGRIARYNASNGTYLGDLDRRGFSFSLFPRGVVFGPDGMLYVSVIGCPIPTDPLFDPLAGYVIRFNAHTGQFVDVFASTNSVPDLHRPEGLAFDHHGDLWVASFRANANDSDRILKLDGRTGVKLDALVLAPPVGSGGIRAYAQAFLFGPGGDLFVPITGGDPTTAGQVRRCNPHSKACKVIVPANSAGGPLIAPFYLSFQATDPSTLSFDGE